MAMSYAEFVDFLKDEKAKILDWGQTESKVLRDKYQPNDAGYKLADIWIRYYDALIAMTEEFEKTERFGKADAIMAIHKENELIGDPDTHGSLIHMLTERIKDAKGEHSSLRMHYQSLINTFRTEARSNRTIIQELEGR